jgi:hypothetical protein
MEITFTCPHCGEVTLIDERFVGQTGPCRACDEVVTVPPFTANANRRATLLPTIGAFLRWCNNNLAYVFLGIFGIGILIACLGPELDASRQTARRMSSGNNLKQIALAMHNYHSAYGRLPRPYWVTESGERTLSWRVAIYPYLEASPLFDMYRPNEPWNSLANREVGSARIPCFIGPWNRDDASGETAYLVVTGPGTLFEEGKDISFDDCADGTSNTILAVEVKRSGITWTEPRDLDIRTMVMQINGEDGNSISSPWKDGAQVAMADGSVKFLSNKTLESTLRAMITRSGGEAFDMPK